MDPRGRVDDARAEAKDALSLFEELGDDLGVGRAWHVIGVAGFISGQSEQTQRALERGLEHARRAGDERLQARLLDYVGSARLYGLTHVDEVLRGAVEALAWARARGSRFLEAEVRIHQLGMGEALRGRIAEGRAQIAQGTAILEELGSLLWLGHAGFAAGYVEHLVADDPTSAEREFLAAYAFTERVGDEWMGASLAAFLTNVLSRQERWEEAERWSEVSERLAAPDNAWNQAMCRTARATVLARRGKVREVERLATEVASLVAELDTFFSADLFLFLAEALLRVGRETDARGFAREALQRYEQKGHVIGATRARALLTELETSGDRG